MDRDYLAQLCEARDVLCGYCEADECENCIVTHLIDDAFNEMGVTSFDEINDEELEG